MGSAVVTKVEFTTTRRPPTITMCSGSSGGGLPKASRAEKFRTFFCAHQSLHAIALLPDFVLAALTRPSTKCERFVG